MPLIAPDTLRKMAKSFTAEDDCVKLQVVNMACKLHLSPELAADRTKIRSMLSYVLELAKYDPSYDIRDRAKVVRVVSGLGGGGGDTDWSVHAGRVLVSPKPVPKDQGLDSGGDGGGSSGADFTFGSLSSVAKRPLPGYCALGAFSESGTSPELRDPLPESTFYGGGNNSNTRSSS
jgi:AP-3 complex subunit beta